MPGQHQYTVFVVQKSITMSVFLSEWPEGKIPNRGEGGGDLHVSNFWTPKEGGFFGRRGGGG